MESVKRMCNVLVFDASIVIPTYNEADNIKKMIGELQSVFSDNSLNVEIIIVDDDSPDGTAKVAKQLSEEYSGIKVVVRTVNKGLSQSVVEGFGHCSSDIIGVIDCDFSHPPALIPEFIDNIKQKDYDIVFGTRYTGKGGIEGWGMKRKIISWGATSIARLFVPFTTDPVSGFFFFRKHVIEGVRLNPIGYKIGLEILGKGNWKRYGEIPYHFKNRERGDSKLGLKEIIEYPIQVLDILIYKFKKKVRA